MKIREFLESNNVQATPFSIYIDVMNKPSQNDTQSACMLVRSGITKYLTPRCDRGLEESDLKEAIESAQADLLKAFPEGEKRPLLSVLVIGEQQGGHIQVAGVGDIALYGATTNGIEKVFCASPVSHKKRLTGPARIKGAVTVVGSPKIEVQTYPVSIDYVGMFVLGYPLYSKLGEDEWTVLAHNPESADIIFDKESGIASYIEPNITVVSPTPKQSKKGSVLITLGAIAAIAAIAITWTNNPSFTETLRKGLPAVTAPHGSQLAQHDSIHEIERVFASEDLYTHDEEVAYLKQMLREKEEIIKAGQANEDALAAQLIAQETQMHELNGTLFELQDIFDEHLALQQHYNELIAEHAELATFKTELEDALFETQDSLKATLGLNQELMDAQGDFEIQASQISALIEDRGSHISTLGQRLVTEQEDHRQTQLALERQNAVISELEREIASYLQGHGASIQNDHLQAELAAAIEGQNTLQTAFQELQRDHLALSEEYDALKQASETIDVAALQADMVRAAEAVEALTGHNVALESELVELTGAKLALQMQADELLALINDKDYQVQELRSHAPYEAELEAALAKERSLRLELTQSLERAEEELVAARKASEEQALEHDHRTQEYLALKQQVEATQLALAEAGEMRLAQGDVTSQLEELNVMLAMERERSKELGLRLEELEQQKVRHQDVAEQVQLAQAQLRARFEELTQSHQEQEVVKNRLEAEFEALHARTKDQQENYAALEQANARLSQELAALTSTRDSLQQECETLAANREQLQAMQDKFDREKQIRVEREEMLSELMHNIKEQRLALESANQARREMAEELASHKAYEGALVFQERTPRARASRQRVGQHVGAPVTKVHIVSPGETLTTIARRYQTTVQELTVANEDTLTDGNHVKVGTALVIP